MCDDGGCGSVYISTNQMFPDQSRVKNKLFGFAHTTTKDGQQFRDRINQLIYYLRVFVEMIHLKKLVNKSL